MICYNFAKMYTVDDAKGICNSKLYISIEHAGELVCSNDFCFLSKIILIE